jgi:hypothetical protein
LIVSVPETLQGAYVWAWASPFVFRPPFQATDLTADRPVLERTGNYFNADRWYERGPFRHLRGTTSAVIVVARETGEVHGWFSPAEKFQPALARAAATPLAPDSVDKFILELTPAP